jgi:hypothetical protein
LGEPGAMVEQLLARRERWASTYLAIKPEHMTVMAPVVARLSGT